MDWEGDEVIGRRCGWGQLRIELELWHQGKMKKEKIGAVLLTATSYCMREARLTLE